MSGPSWRKVLIVAWFFVSLSGFLWLVLAPSKPLALLSRLGFVSAVLSAFWSMAFCWALLLAYLVRKRGWSPRVCATAGLPFIISGLVFFLGDTTRSWGISTLLVTQGSLVGYLCRRLAYPEITDQQAAALEPPLSLFSK